MKGFKRCSLALRQVLLSSALLLVPGVATWAAPAAPSAASASIPADSLYGLPVALVDAQGVKFDWREMAGKPLLVTMFYGDCASACPVLIESLKLTIAELQPAPGAGASGRVAAYEWTAGVQRMTRAEFVRKR